MLRTRTLLAVVALLSHAAIAQQPSTTPWAHEGPDHRLVYQATPGGDRIMDFSYAGYGGGGVPLPAVPVVKELSPSGTDDDSAPIQAALEDLAKLPLGPDGFRGALVLRAGTYNCPKTISLKTTGVVLRGSGTDTVLNMTGSPHLCLSLGARLATKELTKPTPVTDRTVSSGVTTLHVADAGAFKPGDTIQITKPVTPAWVHFMGMDTLVRDGKKQTWLAGEIRAERTIASVDGNAVTLAVPLSDSYDAKYLSPPGASVVKVEVTGRVAHVAVESLRIVAPAQDVSISDRHHQAIRMAGVEDAWLRDLSIIDTVNSVGVEAGSQCVTVQTVDIQHTLPTKGAAKPADFSCSGTQTLFDHCSGKGDNLFYFVTGARVTGPIVLLNCTFQGDGHIQPHARWATGLLVDNCRVSGGGIDLMNRGEMGSGHGWTVGFSVVWNSAAGSFVIQNPPGSTNWSLGNTGEAKLAPMPFTKEPNLPQGTADSANHPLQPNSLYLRQLSDRLGPDAVKRIGY